MSRGRSQRCNHIPNAANPHWARRRLCSAPSARAARSSDFAALPVRPNTVAALCERRAAFVTPPAHDFGRPCARFTQLNSAFGTLTPDFDRLIPDFDALTPVFYVLNTDFFPLISDFYDLTSMFFALKLDFETLKRDLDGAHTNFEALNLDFMAHFIQECPLNPNSEVAAAQPPGSTGHWPVPSGDPPLGTGSVPGLFGAATFQGSLSVIPSGQWPDGTGGSPVLPSLLRSLD